LFWFEKLSVVPGKLEASYGAWNSFMKPIEKDGSLKKVQFFSTVNLLNSSIVRNLDQDLESRSPGKWSE
jgi:hypothetical protein